MRVELLPNLSQQADPDEPRLGGPDEIRQVEEYFERLFPGWAITVMDLR